MISLQLIRHLVLTNKNLINKSAIKDCHAIGLNSFIINSKPKIRLFIAEPHCELYKPFDRRNPIIPIHPHKYDDLFYPIYGGLTHHLYQITTAEEETDWFIKFNKYQYPRLCDEESILTKIDTQMLCYYVSLKNINLSAKDLHTVSLVKDINDRCSWAIIETTRDKSFEQVAYHQNLVERPELYHKLEDGFQYLKNYFSIQ